MVIHMGIEGFTYPFDYGFKIFIITINPTKPSHWSTDL